MPQRTQNFLIHILLLWTTIISIIQIVIIILFFTAGHKGLDSSAVQSSKSQSVENVISTPPPNNGLALSQGKMLTFKASKAEGKIKWTASRPDEDLISECDEGLIMKMDGYYFLNLQVTLSSESDCKGSNNCTVSVMKIREDQKQQLLLEGSINKETRSTGILSKVEEFGTGEKLVVNTSVKCIDDKESKTHLGIIFMLRP